MDIEICSGIDLTKAQGRSPRQMLVTASFYRPFLDSGYRSMIVNLMEAGCFDALIEKAICLSAEKGIKLIPIALGTTTYGLENNQLF